MFCTIGLAGLVGNLFVVVAVIANKKMRHSATNLFITTRDCFTAAGAADADADAAANDDDDDDDDDVTVPLPTSSFRTSPSLTSSSWCSACLLIVYK